MFSFWAIAQLLKESEFDFFIDRGVKGVFSAPLRKRFIYKKITNEIFTKKYFG